MHPELGYRFIGFVDEDGSESSKDKIGSMAELDDLLQKNNIDEVVVSITNSATDTMNKIISVCNKNAVRIHIIPDYFQFLSKKFLVSVIGHFPIITVRDEPLVEIQWRMVKRIFDLIFSIGVILLILSWLVPIISILIKLTSKGPIFFIQDRIGLKNEKFRCFKFRTMYYGEKYSGSEFMPTINGDPRITKIGKFLRKSNLDEMPQFWNILIGDMSIVGPRPHAIAYHEEYVNYFEAIKLRHTVKPGLTGWAQVNGLRGDVSGEEENKKRTIKRIEYDLWYIENWNFSLDLQIILLTVWQMLSRNTHAH
jgi:putative colanic acid biosysnthesis UDP-glucose lipid carrier transferase